MDNETTAPVETTPVADVPAKSSKKKIFAAVAAASVAAAGVLFGTGTIQVTVVQDLFLAVGSMLGLN